MSIGNLSAKGIWARNTSAAEASRAGRRPQRGLMVAELLPILLLAGIYLASFGNPPRSTEPAATIVWVAESEGLLAVNGADGATGLEITQAAGAQVVAVDAQRQIVWTYAQSALSAYTFEGQPVAITPIAPPSGTNNGAPAAALVVNPADGSAWFALHKSLFHYDQYGVLLSTMPLADQIKALALDEINGRLWVATAKALSFINLADNSFNPPLNLGKNPVIKDVDCDPANGNVWVALADKVCLLDDQGTIILQLGIGTAGKIASDGQGGAWLASQSMLTQLDSSGQTLVQAVYPNGFGAIASLAVDQQDATPWVASQKILLHYSIAGQILHTLDFHGEKILNDLAIGVGATPLKLTFLSPSEGSILNIATPTLQLEVQDPDNDVLPDSLEIRANGTLLATSCTFDAGIFTCIPDTSLQEGAVTLTAAIRDAAGTVSNTAQVHFTIDTVPPVIILTSPANGTLTNQTQQTIQGYVSEPCQLTMNAQPVPMDSNLAFSTSATLAESLNSFAFQALDAANNQGQAVLTLTLDTTPPGTVNIYKIMITAGAGQVTLTGLSECAEPNGTLFILNNRTSQTAAVPTNSDGGFTATIPAENGDVLSLWTRDAAGNLGAAVDLTVSTGPVIPPDPITVAPPLDPTVPTDISTGTEFLYAGPRPIQIGVTPGAIEPRRVVVLRGIVRTRDGQPLAGVEITAKDHPEYGYTLTRNDGMFDFVANGGASLVVNYAKEEYLPAQRTIPAPWQEYVWLPDVVLIPLDAQATVVDLAAPGLKTAQGSPVTDADGNRRATLLFPEGTTAAMQFADETTQPLTTLTIRATEYTVGPNGPKAMPAELPPTSAYTYCVELSSDEALQAGAKTVLFGQPIPFYIENFLGFPTGKSVPVGYYDYDKAAWIPAPNGKIVKILTITGGLANLDLVGNGIAATSAQLQALGITTAERARLATLYTPGQSLWRVPVSHFTPMDCNMPPYGPPAGGGPPTTPKPTSPGTTTEGSCTAGGSIIDIQNQNLGEAIPITGTPYGLHYQSDRTMGKKAAYTVDIVLSKDTVPAPLKRIELTTEVAGKKSAATFSAQPNQQTRIQWDGKDAYGRTIQGQQTLRVRVGYAYDAVYGSPNPTNPSAFATFGTAPMEGGGSRNEITLWAEFELPIGTFSAPTQDLGGFSITPHHTYDSASHTLFQGGGQRRIADEYIITTIAGNGSTVGAPIDGIPAKEAAFNLISDIAFGPDGSFYIADASNSRVRKVAPDGNIYTIAGNGFCDPFNDNIDAKLASLCEPDGVDVGPDGSVYIAVSQQYKIYRVSPSGIISTVAGNGTFGNAGDGGPAVQASLNNPVNVTLDDAGGFYILEWRNVYGFIRYVSPSGIISFIGGGYCNYGGDDGPVRQACMRWVRDLNIAADGSVTFGDGYNHRVRRFASDGIIATIAGGPTGGYSGDGGPALLARLGEPFDAAITPDESVYFTDNTSKRIRRIAPDGIITTVAGNGQIGFNGDGNYATQTSMGPTYIDVGPDGTIYFVDNANHRVRKITRGFPGFSTEEFGIASTDGSEVYVFHQSGKHLRTINALTGAVLHLFAYTTDGLLSQIQDESGNLTRIERSADGKPTAIIGPEGQRTGIGLNGHGYISSITNPAYETVQFDYTPEGLMRHMTDAKNQIYTFDYNTLGQLETDTNPGTGATILTRTDTADGFTMEKQTSEGRVSTYTTETLSTGVKRRTVTDAGCNCSTEVLIEPNGLTTATKPDGTITTSQEGPDPRFKMQTPLPQSVTVKTPSGLTSTTTTSRTTVLADPDNPLSLQSQTDTIKINGKNYTSTYTSADRTFTLASPAGRQSMSTIDAKGRISTVQIPGLEPVSYSYDSKGRLGGIVQGARSFSLTYDPQGYVDTIRDSLNRTVGFDYDDAGRATRQYLPDTRQIAFAYDDNGNLTSLTPPGKPEHQFTYYNTDLQENYIPPDIGINTTTHYSYNLDKDITQIVRPDGKTLGFGYDGSGRLSSLTTPEGTTGLTYNASSNQLETIASPNGENLTFSYDGPLDMGTTWIGPIQGSVSRTFSADFRVTSTSVNGANIISYGYDNDGLLASAGEMALQRNAQNGLLTGTTMGTMVDSYSYNTYGEPIGYTATLPSGFAYSESYVRDNLGRITQKTEIFAGTQAVYDYTYDTGGRLTSVKKNNITVEHYAYDSNGNRLSASTVTGGSVSATCDDQDRLLTYGNTTFTYTPNGELLTKDEASQLTAYIYDVLGNLLSVTLPDGTLIEYVVDGLNRRIGKKVNGTMVQGFLYEDQLRPAVELDGAGNIVSRFVYATKINVPEYMIKGGVTYRIITDHLGSPRLLVNASDGTVVQQMEYDAFGNVLVDTNPGFQPFGFAGGIYDRDTGFLRFGLRDYYPTIGRWCSKDPLVYMGEGANIYAYVGNDPINYIDPQGLFRSHWILRAFVPGQVAWDNAVTAFQQRDNIGAAVNFIAML